MKILIDARMYGLENSGIGRYLINLISELQHSDGGHEYFVLLRDKYFKELKFKNNWKKIRADFRHYTFKEQLDLPRIISGIKPDLTHFPHLNIPLLWMGKFVATVHDLTMQRQKTDATTLPLPVYYFKRIPFLMLARLTVFKAQKILVPSQFVKDDITNYYRIDPSKITVTFEGYSKLQVSGKKDAKLKKYGLREPYFIYVGNAYPHKNLELAVKAIVLLNKNAKQKIYLAIGGSRGVFTDRLKKLIEKEGADDLVRLIGYVDDSDLGDLYKGSLAFVYPSFAEGYGLQGLEAMSTGTLVLASDITVFKEIYGNNALYFDPRDAYGLTEQMKNVLKLTPIGRKKRIENALKFINRYSWKTMAGKTLEVYNNALSK